MGSGELWKTFCIIPVPQEARRSKLSNLRPVAMTSHVTKTNGMACASSPEATGPARSQLSAFWEKVPVEDASEHLQSRHWSSGTKLLGMGVEPHLEAWTTDHPTGNTSVRKTRALQTRHCGLQRRSAAGNCSLSTAVHYGRCGLHHKWTPLSSLRTISCTHRDIALIA